MTPLRTPHDALTGLHTFAFVSALICRFRSGHHPAPIDHHKAPSGLPRPSHGLFALTAS